ncbi:hypothetical protein O7623_17335 [Solwaraspora sp. WMMD791]|uniref:hypothetical protein n=1 Tax=Solwaraspora sp. WMMD791 TaxID=3016086 RepID=UPI00249B5538|nr:hypothetical protein [Solwaraspora sp. WMMD791]WFE25171.1 hypothetical protein O7623_17335 [Solwaraspora sp. WMMD791]
MEQVIAQMQRAKGQLAEAAVTAMRAKVDFDEAYKLYFQLSEGSANPNIRRAASEAQTAAAKAGRYANLLDRVQRHYQAYFARVAPAANLGSPSGVPSGEKLLSDTGRRASRREQFLRQQVQKADDTQESLSKFEANAKTLVDYFKKLPDPPGATSSNPVKVDPAPTGERVDVDNPITAVAMAAGALAIALKATINNVKKNRERKRRSGNES